MEGDHGAQGDLSPSRGNQCPIQKKIYVFTQGKLKIIEEHNSRINSTIAVAGYIIQHPKNQVLT